MYVNTAKPSCTYYVLEIQPSLLKCKTSFLPCMPQIKYIHVCICKFVQLCNSSHLFLSQTYTHTYLVQGAGERRSSLLARGVMACFYPVMGFFGKKPYDNRNGEGSDGNDDWEIPYGEISDHQFIGSGSQGAVYSGRLRGQRVAVKKVKEVKYTDIYHLRDLSHPNVITFM